jgi:hypothetical protein
VDAAKGATLYMVAGPTVSIKYLHGKSVPGGWAYALANITNLDIMNPKGLDLVIVGHLTNWGDIPKIPKTQNFRIETVLLKESDLGPRYDKSPSNQHGSILNALISKRPPETLFYGVLDPDCYLLMKNSLSEVQQHMLLNDLGAFGVPYSPKRINYRDFPTVFFSLFRADKISPLELDFTPPGDTASDKNRTPLNKRFLLRKILLTGPLDLVQGVLLWLAVLSPAIPNWPFVLFVQTRFALSNMKVGRVQLDTGNKIREVFKEKALKFETVRSLEQEFRLRIGLDESEYLLTNPDVAEAQLNPTWHFLMFGLHQRRSYGKQNLWVQALTLAFRPKHSLDFRVFHTPSITSGQKLIELRRYRFWRKFIFSDQYNWKNRPFAIHLSTYGKNRDRKDLVRLERLFSQTH